MSAFAVMIATSKHAMTTIPGQNSVTLIAVEYFWQGSPPALLLKSSSPGVEERHIARSPAFTVPAGAGRVIAREHRAQHAPRISREGVVFREPPDMAGGPVFSAQRRVAQPQSLGSATGKIIPRNGTLENG